MQKRLYKRIRNRYLTDNGIGIVTDELELRMKDQINSLYVDQRGYLWKLIKIANDKVTFNCSCLFWHMVVTAQNIENSSQLSETKYSFKVVGDTSHHYHHPISLVDFSDLENSQLSIKKCESKRNKSIENDDTKDTLMNCNNSSQNTADFDEQFSIHSNQIKFDNMINDYRYPSQINSNSQISTNQDIIWRLNDCNKRKIDIASNIFSLNEDVDNLKHSNISLNTEQNSELNDESWISTDNSQVVVPLPRAESKLIDTSSKAIIIDSYESNESTADSNENASKSTNSMVIRFDNLNSLIQLKLELQKRNINLDALWNIKSNTSECASEHDNKTPNSSQILLEIKNEIDPKCQQKISTEIMSFLSQMW